MSVKVLLVDDEADAAELFRQNFRRELRRDAFRFLFAQSGSEALDIIRGDDGIGIVVVLSDINMPGMDGLELVSELSRLRPEIPVIMITAYADGEKADDARARGADEVLAKPVDFARLRERLGGLIADAEA